jgi:hypothetical protein
MSGVSRAAKAFTLHRRPPGEADMQVSFGDTPPSDHQLVSSLERGGCHQTTRIVRQRLAELV